MNKKIAGKEVTFYLNDNGLIESREFGVSANTFDECAELVRKAIIEIDAAANENKGVRVMQIKYRSGFAVGKLGKRDGSQTWFIEDASGERTKASNSSIFVYDQSVIDAMKDIDARIKALEEEKENIESLAENFYK